MTAISNSVSRQQSTHQKQKYHALCRWIFSLYALYLFLMLAGSVCNLVFLCCVPADNISMTDTGNGVKIQLLFGFLRLSEGYLPPDYMNTSAQLLGIPMLLFDLLLKYLPQVLICVQLQNIFRKLKATVTPFFPEIVSYIRRISYTMLFLGFFSQFLLQMIVFFIAYRTVYFSNPLQFSWVLAGCITLLLADIFRRGCVLQKESDETF